jgi:TNF receptor-associated protein 1
MEAMQAQDTEVLFCYENFDELVLMNLGQFDKKTLKSVENELATSTTDKPSSSDSTSGKQSVAVTNVH